MSTDLLATSVGERNAELFRRLLVEGFGRGNVGVVDEVIAPDYREHQPGFAPGPEGIKGAIRYLHSAFPDLSMTVEDIVIDGDKIWGRMRAHGTNLGPIMGQAATGKPMEITVIDICRFADGKMVEHWGVPDRFAQMEQLGLLPKPQPMTASGAQ
jgi:predicted SnoaL-like aldol condensation-catalyzing enzyme